MKAAGRPALQGALLHAWKHRGWLATLLWPASQVFRALSMLRKVLYASGALKSHRVDALVVVVGNVIAGGAGKTPTVMALVGHLQAQKYSVGVISRGYGRSGDACLEVTAGSAPQDVGDEPLLVRRSTGVPVFVARTRYQAARALLARYPETRIIVCDDGLQHYALYRDLEVCVFDDRGCGNGWLLPAGPLREPWPRDSIGRTGQRDDRFLVLHTGTHPTFDGFTAQRSLAPYGVRCDGTRVDLNDLRADVTRPILAVAGIGQPEAFFAMLRALQLPLTETMALPDHYDFNSYNSTVYAGYSVICTEKDAAKLWQHVPQAVAIPLRLAIEPAFFAAVDECIAEQIAAKLSLAHGHTTT